MLVQEPPFMQRSINHAKECRVTNSKCMLTPTEFENHLQVICSHMHGQHAYPNPGIDESGIQYVYKYLGGLGACCRKILRFSCHESFWCNLRLDARLETIK